MLGFSFPPSHLGVLACFGLVPLLVVLADLRRLWSALRYSYIAVLVFHVITLNWTGGYAHGKDIYMMIAGAVTMIVHPVFYWIPISAYVFTRRWLGAGVALIGLPFFWVGYEYSHSLTEWSFPWLTIGNSQSYDIARMQFISTTGIYGLSLWVLLINVLAFILYSRLAHTMWRVLSQKSILFVVLLAGCYFAPSIHGAFVLSHDSSFQREGERLPETIRVGMMQSNIDPWEKWKMSGPSAIRLYLDLTRSLVLREEREGHRPDLVLWPETAIPYYVLQASNHELLAYIRERLDSIGVAVLTGLPHMVVYADSARAPRTAKRLPTSGERYDTFNAAALFQPGVREIPWYGKMRMVPLAERVPYAEAFHFLDFLQWNVGIGGWQIGPDSTVFIEAKTGTRFSTMICYESTYPDFVASFVRKGAEFIAIITIDSWWDRMSGAYQHAQFAIFRAVENRRWIARCAVGGISCFIDPYGRVYDATDLFTQATLVRTFGRRSELSFYTSHGDWLGVAALFLSGMFLAAGIGEGFRNKQRQSLWTSSTL
jgi:apolipoprotein N-acyltransferase